METIIQTMLLLDSLHKILAIGWEPFSQDFWYCVEGVISSLAVSFALFEFIEAERAISGTNTSRNDATVIASLYGNHYIIARSLSILRVVPLLRVINQLRSVRIVLTSIYQSFAYIGHLCIVVLCVW